MVRTISLVSTREVRRTTTITRRYTHPCPPFCIPPPAHTRERFRDFSGLLTLHRLLLLSWLALTTVVLLRLRAAVFPPAGPVSPHSDKWYAHPLLSLLLILPVVNYSITFVGALLFRFNPRLDETAPISHPVVWRIVSRGFNRDCLLETISRCREEMHRNPLFPYLIEVVTDSGKFEAPNEPDVLHVKVPNAYVTPNNTKFKARALHYACHHSLVPPHAWIVHLDEETRPTSSAMKGISAFIAKCEREGAYKRIGQGIILYHRSWTTFPLLTLADMPRTGEDVGNFYLQAWLGTPIVGLHGSYIVCMAGEEASLGFDVGPEGSITEDCWWVFLASKAGFRLHWIDGFLEEQSTESLADFLKQRRRWMVGQLKVMINHPTSMRVRGAFLFLMARWVASPFVLPVQLVYVATLIVRRIEVPVAVVMLSMFNISMAFYPYLVGWAINLLEGMQVRWWRVPLWTMVLLMLIPVFQGLELFALVLAFFAEWSKTAQGFHIVEKSTQRRISSPNGVANPGKDEMV